MAEMYNQNQEERERFDEKPMGSSTKREDNPYRNYSKPAKPVTTSNPVLGAQGIVELTEIRVSASVTQVPPSEVVQNGGFDFALSNIVPSENISGSYAPSDPSSSIELFIYDYNRNIVSRDYNYQDWKITKNTEAPNVPTTYINDEGIEVIEDQPVELTTDIIEVNPAGDAYDKGIDNGDVFVVYNFLTNELASNADNPFYLDEISGDRTEIRLRSNTIQDADIRRAYLAFTSKLNSSEYFDEFYVNFYNNDYAVGINCILEDDEEQGLSVLIKTYSPIPPKFSIGDQLYVVTKPSETIAYLVDYVEDFSDLVDKANYIKGPNVNISLQDLVNNSTTLKSYEDLTNTASSSSLDNVLNVLNQKGVTITPDYSYNTFNEFVNFSSAKARINNFYEKVSQIQSYQADIDTISATTGSNPTVLQISQSLASLQTNITNLVKNFDGYETYLYQNSSSFAYPKTGSSYPYTLLPTGSTEVLEWMGSDVEGSQYYGGIILSASLYDENNQNWLYYTIPDFITENADNDNYITFTNMVGQSFDEIWLYTKALSERYNTINDPDKGLPLDLAADAIKNLGFETFGNNYDNQDNFIGLTGEDNGVYVPPTGSELITQYIAINNGQIVNYWDIGYSWLNYVQQINEPGFPYAIDKVSKEIYKRLYHNMAYLTKKKGTISGLRQLINIWGIPNTILRINEFGGKNRDNTDDYDLWYKRYSYAYTPVANTYAASSSVRVPWMPLQRNLIADSEYIVPDGIALRFKTFGHPSSSYGGSYYSQSIAVKKSNGTANDEFDWGIGLFYEDQPSGSYSGSSFSDYYDYGKLRFYLSGSAADGGVAISNDIELPFFDGGWWTVLLQRDQHVSASDNSQNTTYTLYVGNKLDNGWDGNNIGWTGSVSITSNVSSSVNEAWNSFGVNENDGVYVGGYVSGSKVGAEVLNENSKIFSGSLQEFRYYSNDIAQTVFNDFVMNPESVEGNNITGSESSFDIVNFRAPLGNELEHIFTSSVSGSYSENISSSHPAITGSAPSVITGSFIDPATSAVTSSYEFIHYSASTTRTFSKTNVETYFLDQPSIGVRNRVSNKIQIDDGEVYGNVLSKYRSIQQNYLISESYTEDTTGLEVGFSPQDEVNDDIIATYGYGVISDTLADPRFAYSGSQTYYPQLRRTAEDYFKKYTEGNVWDYLRLIKYFDNSIFKAIKSYVPARTSVTTGVIVKQHMLERNRRVPVTIDPNTVIAYTPETGSVVGGQSTATGNNSPISYRNLMITGSIDFLSVTGSNGGTPPELYGNVSSSGAGMNIVAITQSWTGSNKTISGSITYIDETQTEFFNGEFSGSEFIATTQSLLNNPFAPSQVLNTEYVINVSASDGRFSNFLSASIDAFPSFSLFTDVYVYPWNIEPDQVDIDIENYKDRIEALSFTDKFSRAAIFLFQSRNDFRNFFIKAIAFPPIAYADPYFTSTPLVSIEPNSLFGFNNQNEWEGGIKDIPLPPISASGMVGGLYTGSGATPLYQPNNIGPYFKFNISGSGFFNPTATVGGFSPVDFAVNGSAGNLPSNILISSLLGSKDSITLDGDTIQTNQFNMLLYRMPQGSFSGQKPVRINGFLDQPISQSFNNTTQVTMSLYVSNYDQTYDSEYHTFVGNKGWLTLQTQNPNPIGTGSLLLQGTTWTGSYGDSGYWAPYGLVLNERNYDEFGDIIVNTNTLANLPDFDFTLTDALPGGEPATSDDYGLSGSLFRQSLNEIEGLISVNNPDPLLNSIGYSYDYVNSRLLSGSAFSTTLPTLWRPTGSQDSQYINFNPQLPPFANFYNTPFNALINNVSQSRPNTYLQVVEYEGGSSTGSSGVPSNIIPITSGSAVKADVPDSFYTQKSSTIPRYLGSRLQSANYNTFTPSGSDIIYLNSISGSALSGSNQSVEGNCFIAGTQITLQDINKTKNIEDVKVGETILTYNEDTQKQEPGVVGDLQIREVESIIRLTFDNGNIINTTSEHPFYVEGKNWVTANNLVVGDVCKTVSNTLSILSSIETINKTTTVYNLLSVAPNHNFYANNILVHNKGVPVSITSSVWGGDASPGTMKSVNTPISTIFKSPIYFAHYKSSKQNPELYGTYTFDIDSLIQVPFEDITGDKAPTLPTILKVDGTNDRLTDVRSTFEVDRKTAISYNTTVQYISGSTSKIDYTTLPIGENRIYQGGLEYQNIFTTQPAQNETTLTASCLTCSWFQAFETDDVANRRNLISSSYDSIAETGSSGYGFLKVVTGSEGGDSGEFKLTGAPFTFSGSWRATSTSGQFYWRSESPCLATVHSLNVLASMSIQVGTNYVSGGGMPGIPQISGAVLPSNPESFWRYNSELSATTTGENGLLDYQDFGQNLIFKKGDEIRVEWNVDETGEPNRQVLNSQVFTIIDVPPSGAEDGTPTSTEEFYWEQGSDFFYLPTGWNKSRLYNRLVVYPNPRDYNIPDDTVSSFTVRRRVNADDRVIVYQQAPQNVQGARTPSPSGYLIPGDMTPTQKANIRSLITQLDAKNAFPSDRVDNEPIRGEGF